MQPVVGAAVVALFLVPVGAWAQTARGVATPPGISVTRPPEPPAPAPAPPPPQRPDPPPHAHHHATPGADSGGDLFLAGPRTYAPRFNRRSRWQPYFFPGYWGGAYPPQIAPPVYEEQMGSGYLRLQIEPRTAQVYVDGFFVGTIADLSGFRYPIEPGLHRIELVAQGFDPLAFEVRIRADETVTYTRSLVRLTQRSPVAPAAIAARATLPTLYVIPRCYAGDKPPVASALPAGCDLSQLRTLP